MIGRSITNAELYRVYEMCAIIDSRSRMEDLATRAVRGSRRSLNKTV